MSLSNELPRIRDYSLLGSSSAQGRTLCPWADNKPASQYNLALRSNSFDKLIIPCTFHTWFNYSRLRTLKLPSLCTRRKNADMAFTYKLLHNLLDINSESLGIRLCDGNTRGSGVNLALCRASTELRRNTFCYRVQRQWNKLLHLAKYAPSSATFKSNIV